MVLDHAFDIEFFYGNHAEAIDQPSGCLMHEIMATVTNPLMDTRDDLLGFPPLAGTTNLFCQLPLCFGKGLLITAEETRIGDVLPVGHGRKGFQPNINADFLGRRRQEFGADFAGQADVPLGIDTTNGTGFDCAVNWAVQSNSNVANLGQSQLALIEAKARLWVGERIVSVALDTGKAWGLSALDPTEKGVKSKVNTDGDILQDLAVDAAQFGVFLFPLGERGLLLYFGRRLGQHVVVMLAPVQEAVVDLSAGFQCLRQSRLLRLCRVGAENIG